MAARPPQSLARAQRCAHVARTKEISQPPMINPCICILIVAPPSAETARNAPPPPHPASLLPLSRTACFQSSRAKKNAWWAQALVSHRDCVCLSLFHRAIFKEEAFRRPPGRGGRRDHALISGRGPFNRVGPPRTAPLARGGSLCGMDGRPRSPFRGGVHKKRKLQLRHSLRSERATT